MATLVNLGADENFALWARMPGRMPKARPRSAADAERFLVNLFPLPHGHAASEEKSKPLPPAEGNPHRDFFNLF